MANYDKKFDEGVSLRRSSLDRHAERMSLAAAIQIVMRISDLQARQACEIVRGNYQPTMKYRDIERMFQEQTFPRQA
jgi:hypothetical protein